MLNKLLNQKVNWLADSGPDDDIAISSRIRLARNINDIPFPQCASHKQLTAVANKINLAVLNIEELKNNQGHFVLNKMTPLDKRILLERRLVSNECLNAKSSSEVIFSLDEKFSIIINEEDHLRLQAIKPGFQLDKVWDIINNFDDAIAKKVQYAFDAKLGFLTSCPTNIGTGMRASVMLHLPALVLTNKMKAIMNGAFKLGLVVRGFYGEGSDNLGNLFQVSNQSTLGEPEFEIISKLKKVINQIISQEKNARQYLLENDQNLILDNVGKSYGRLRHAYILTAKDAIDGLSFIRLGVDLGMFSNIDIHLVNNLFVTIQPGHLQKFAKKAMSSKHRNALRATLLREQFAILESGQI